MNKKNAKQFIILFFFLTILFFSNCFSFEYTDDAMRFINKGDNYNAVLSLINALKLYNANRKAYDLLIRFYPRAVDDELKNIEQLKDKNNINWDKIVFYYQRLIKMDEAISDLQKIDYFKEKKILFFNKTDYSGAYREALNYAAELHYNEGVELSKIDDKDIQKKACYEFKKALEYISNFKDSHELYIKAKNNAVKIVLIILNDNDTNNDSDIDIKEKFSTAFNKIYKNNLNKIEFFKIHKIEYNNTESKDKNIDEIFTINIININYQSPVILRDIYIDEGITFSKLHNGQIITEKTFAEVTTHTLNYSIKINSDYIIKEAVKEKTVKEDKHFTSYKYEHSWATYTGEYEALSYHSRQLCQNQIPVSISKSEIYTIIMNQLAGEYYNIIYNVYDSQ